MLAIRPIQRHRESLGWLFRRKMQQAHRAAGCPAPMAGSTRSRFFAKLPFESGHAQTKLGSERKTARFTDDPMPLTGPKAAKIRSFIVERSGALL